MRDIDIEAIWGTLRQELQRDFVGLWMVVSRVKRAHPHADDDEVRRLTLEVVRMVVATGEAEIGTRPLGPAGLADVWSCDADQAIARISREWDELGREPSVWEIAWLQPQGYRQG